MSNAALVALIIGWRMVSVMMIAMLLNVNMIEATVIKAKSWKTAPEVATEIELETVIAIASAMWKHASLIMETAKA